MHKSSLLLTFCCKSSAQHRSCSDACAYTAFRDASVGSGSQHLSPPAAGPPLILPGHPRVRSAYYANCWKPLPASFLESKRTISDSHCYRKAELLLRLPRGLGEDNGDISVLSSRITSSRYSLTKYRKYLAHFLIPAQIVLSPTINISKSSIL